MNRLKQLLLFVYFLIAQYGYGQEFSGYLCGDKTFIAPAILSNSFLENEEYKWQVQSRIPLFELGLEDTTEIDFINVEEYCLQGGFSSLKIISTDTALIQKQIRIRVTRGELQTKWEYFYVYPNLLSTEVNMESEKGFTLSDQANDIDICLGEISRFSLNNTIGQYKTNDQFNVIIYYDSAGSWYHYDSLYNTYKVNAVENAVIQFNGENFDINYQTENAVLLRSSTDHLTLSLKENSSIKKYKFYFQIIERVNSIAENNSIENFLQIVQHNLNSTNKCGDPLLFEFDSTLYRDNLKINNKTINKPYFTITEKASAFYGTDIIVKPYIEGGGFQGVNPIYTPSTFNIASFQWPNDGSNLDLFTLDTLEYSKNMYYCSDSIILNLKSIPPIKPTFSFVKNDLDQQNPLGSIRVTNNFHAIDSIHYYDEYFELYKDSILTQSNINGDFNQLIPGHYLLRKIIKTKKGLSVPDVHFYLEKEIEIKNNRTSVYFKEAQKKYITEHLSFGGDSTISKEFSQIIKPTQKTSSYTRFILLNESFKDTVWIFNNEFDSLLFENVLVGNYLDSLLTYDLKITEFDSSKTIEIFDTLHTDVMSLIEAKPLSFKDVDYIAVPYYAGGFNELTRFNFTISGDHSYSNYYQSFVCQESDGDWIFLDSIYIDLSTINSSISKPQTFTRFKEHEEYFIITFDQILLTDSIKENIIKSYINDSIASEHKGNFDICGPYKYASHKTKVDNVSFLNGKSSQDQFQLICNNDETGVDLKIINDSIFNYQTPYLAISEVGEYPISIDDFKKVGEDFHWVSEGTILKSGRYSIYLMEDTVYKLHLEDDLFGYYEASIVEVNEPDPIEVTNEIISTYVDDKNNSFHVSRFNGKDGKLKTSIIGGVPPFSSKLNGQVDLGISDHNNEIIFDSLSANKFFIETIQDSYSCSSILLGYDTLELLAPDSLMITQFKSSIKYGESIIYDISKSGGKDGQITLQCIGGIDQYKSYLFYSENKKEYSLLDSNINFLEGESIFFNTLEAGYYQVLVKDKYYDQSIEDEYHRDSLLIFDNAVIKGDIVISNVIQLKEPEPIKVEIVGLKNYQTQSDLQDLHVQCAFGTKSKTGKVYIEIKGGIPMTKDAKSFYRLAIENNLGKDTLQILTNTSSFKSTFDSISNLPQGILKLNVIDNQGNNAFADTILLAPDPLEITFLSPIRPSCIDGNDGQLQVDIQGGIRQNETFDYTLQFGNQAVLSSKLKEYNQSEGFKEFQLKDNYDCPCNLVQDQTQDYKSSFTDPENYFNVISFNDEKVAQVNAIIDISSPTSFGYYLSDYPSFSCHVISDSTSCYSDENGFENYSDGGLTLYNFQGGTNDFFDLQILKNNLLIEEYNKVANDSVLIIKNLSAGSYQLSVKNQECSQYSVIDSLYIDKYRGKLGYITLGTLSPNGQVKIGEPAPLSVATSINEPLCFGTSTAQLKIGIRGGHTPYTIQVFEEDLNGNFSDKIIEKLTSEEIYTLDNLKGNRSYKIYVKDILNCEVQTRYDDAIVKGNDEKGYFGIYYIPEKENVILPQPHLVRKQHLTCENIINGTLSFFSIGNEEGTQFKWMSEAGIISEILLIDNSQDLKELKWGNLSKGIYTLFYKESEDCQWVNSYIQKEINIEPPLKINEIFFTKSANEDYTLFVEVENIKGALQLSKIEGDSMKLISDTLSVNSVSTYFEKLKEGEYKLDYFYEEFSQLCDKDVQHITTQNAIENTIAFLLNIQNTSCENSNDGRVELQLINRNSSQIQSILWMDSNRELLSTNESFEEIYAGDYSVEIIDIYGYSITKTFTVNSSEQLTISNTLLKEPTCYNSTDGSITVFIEGGKSSQYSYQWSNDLGEVISTDSILQNVPDGEYKFIVSEENNLSCFIEKSFNLVGPSEIHVKNSIRQEPTYFGKEDAQIIIEVEGGSKPYFYNWGNRNIFSDTLMNIGVGDYHLQIIDQEGCLKDTIISIDNQPDPIVVNIIEHSRETCSGANDASITVEIKGGTPPYLLEWNNNQRGNTLVGVSAGTYSLKITDHYLNTVFEDIEVDGNSQMNIEVDSIISPSCVGSDDGAIILNISGGSGEYIFEESNVKKLSNHFYKIESLPEGKYDFNIIDKNNCFASIYGIQLSDPDPLEIVSFRLQNPTCSEIQNGLIQIEDVKGGSGEYTFEWDNHSLENVSLISGLQEGNYTVTITDKEYGCSLQKTFSLESPSSLEVEIQEKTSPTCVNGTDGLIKIKVLGGNPPYRVTWDDNSSSTIRANLTKGEYFVLIEDENECSISKTIVIDDPDELILNVHHLEDQIQLCTGTELALDAGDNWEKVEWSSDFGFISDQQLVRLNRAGNYKLSVYNGLGCHTEKTFEIIEREDLLEANFVIESSPEFGVETFHIIDLSWPIPDEIIWEILPKVNVIDSSKHQQEIRFQEEGEHRIILTSYLGNCFAVKEKTIEVESLNNGRFTISSSPGKKELELTDTDTDILYFNAFPNPIQNSINIELELNEKRDFEIQLISIGNSQLMWKEKYFHKEKLLLRYENQFLPTGMYLLQLITNDSIQIIKIFKN